MTHSTSATGHDKASFYEPISKRLAREKEQRASASTAIRKLGAAVRKIKKSAIGSPVAFRHELHVGVDSPILGSALLNEIWDEKGWTRKDLAYSLLLQTSPLNTSFAITNMDLEENSVLDGSNKHQKRSKRSSTIKRKAVPLDFSDILEPVPKLPFSELTNTSSSTPSSSSSLSSSLSQSSASKADFQPKMSENLVQELSLSADLEVLPAHDIDGTTENDEGIIIVYAIGGEEEELKSADIEISYSNEQDLTCVTESVCQ